MANTARKERKRAGIKFERVAKVGTPPEERAIPVVYDKQGRSRGADIQHTSNRAKVRLKRIFGLEDAA